MLPINVPSRIYFSLFIVLFLVIFNFTLTMMNSIYIVGELGGSPYITTYTIIFYSLGNALGIPLGTPISNRIGVIKLLVTCLLLFAFFSFICAIATNYPLFVTTRFLQGFVAGPFYILVNRLFSVLTPETKKEKFTSITITIFAVCPVVGASVGGWIGYEYHWRWLFIADVPVVLFLAVFLGFQLKKYVLFEIQKTYVDLIGYFFYFVGTFCLCFVFTTGQEFDWWRSSLINVLTIIGIICFTFFVLWEVHHPHPILDLKLFSKPAFSFALLNLALLFSAYFGMVILLALFLSLYTDFTPLWIALLIGHMAIAGALPSYLVAKKNENIDCRIPLSIAIILLAISCFYTTSFDVDINFGRIAFSRVLAGFGLAFFLPPIFRICFHTYDEEKILNVINVFQGVRALSCGFGAAFYIILWQRRQIFYHDRLGSGLTVFSQKTKNFFMKAKEFNLKGLPADAKLDVLLDRQATSLALDDCFFLMGWVMITLLIVLLLSLFFKSDVFFPEKNRIKTVRHETG